jgi:hypothetical protein
MGLPSININISNNNLGRESATADGTCGLIVSGVAVIGQFALGDVLGPFTALEEIEAIGITAAYDTTNTVLAHRHCLDFFSVAPTGTQLYLMVVAKTITMADICLETNNYAKRLLTTAAGAIRLIAVTRVPATVGTIANQFEQDLFDAIGNMQTLLNNEATAYRPARCIIEGRNFQGNATSAQDLRTLTANRVMVVMCQDNDVATAAAHANKYACAGLVLGIASARPVQRNIGRVKDGPVGITKPALSSGALLSSLTSNTLDTLHNKGYVFFRDFVGLAGYYLNDDNMSVALTDDYAQLTLGRVIDKASRIAYSTYVNELLDEVDVDSNGRLSQPTCKHYQALIETAIQQGMAGEIVNVSAYVDPNQDIIATSQLNIELNIQPFGINRTINITIGFASTLS